MKVKIESAFVKPNQDVKNGDLITFLNSGEERKSERFGKMQFNIKIRTADGDEKLLTMNNTSKRNMVSAFGEDSEKWIGKEVKVNIVPSMVSGQMKNVVVLTLPNLTLEGEPILG